MGAPEWGPLVEHHAPPHGGQSEWRLMAAESVPEAHSVEGPLANQLPRVRTPRGIYVYRYPGRNVFPALTPTSPPEKRRDAKTDTAEPSRRKETTGMSGTPRGARGIVACHKCSAASSKR
ncbi:hypothetical protein M8J76_009077 [Diaphorina citri]|nr:hypothetical protein M8J76_009077 [Diaphorina citri]